MISHKICIIFWSFCLLSSYNDCSKSCNQLFYTGIDARPLQGTWYITLESGISNPMNYCASFQVNVWKLKHLKIKVLDMRKSSNQSVTLSGVLQPGGKLEITTKYFTLVTYNVLVIHKDYFCIYECGEGRKDDYVQCATRVPDVSTKISKSIFRNLQKIGINIKRRNFFKLEYSVCN